MVDLNTLVIFDPATSTLYAARDLPMVMNGQALQLTLPSNSSLKSMEMEKPKRSKVSKKAQTSRRNLSKALREANSKLRLKNGQLRKGKTQKDVMRLAQKLKKKM